MARARASPEPFTNVLNVLLASPRIINYLLHLHNNCDNKLTIETIKSIDLTLTGRRVINSLLKYKSNYGLDLITKRDLITI